jgi:flavin-dependent dehydrogenase
MTEQSLTWSIFMALLGTMKLADAASLAWEVIVVGAGPAGSLAARELARRGVAVLLVDKAAFPRWKVCGCCVNPWAQETLSSVGLGGLLNRQGGIALEGIQLGAGGGQAFVHLPGEMALSRTALDAALIEAAIAAGAHFLPSTLARLGGVGPQQREITLRQERQEMQATAKIVVAADGLGCRLLASQGDAQPEIQSGSRLGAGLVVENFPGFYQAPRIFMACGTGGYVGLVRVEDGRLDMAAAFDPVQVKRAGGLGKTAQNILAEAGFPAISEMTTRAWQGTPLLTRRLTRPAAERIFLIGDAAGYVEPFTGEGIAWALACGKAIAPIAQRAAQHWEERQARQWTALYRHMIKRRQWVIRSLALVLRRPLLARALVATLSRVPMLASPVVQYLHATSD